MKNLLVINGHPDPRPERFCGALSDAYERGANTGGWKTRRLNVGDLALSSIEAMSNGEDPGADVQDTLGNMEWANRLAIIYPLWFDQPPDTLRVLFDYIEGTIPGGAAERRRAHIIVTMEMPAFAYRSMLRPGTSKMTTDLALPGVLPDEPVLIGCVNTITREQRRRWLETVRGYGERSNCGTTAAPSRSLAFASMIDRTVAQWWSGN
jgi:putative NADPH-quinone reductase